jgi:hypothetical protein
MAEEEGLEPSHAGIKIQCLNQLGDSPNSFDLSRLPLWCGEPWREAKDGAFGWSRTSDTRIFNPVLYQLSYESEN